jgi:hypothetical protein
MVNASVFSSRIYRQLTTGNWQLFSVCVKAFQKAKGLAIREPPGLRAVRRNQ